MSLSSIILNTNTSVGASIAVDTVSSKSYQQFKLVDGTTGGTDGLPGSAADGLLVNLGSNNDVTVGAITINSIGTADGNLDVDVTDRSARDCGKVDIAAFDVGLPANSGVDIGDVTINNASGASAVNIQDGGNSITVDGTVSITANSAVNVAQINGVTPLMGNGASGTGAQRVTIANDSTGILATVSTVTTVSTLTGGGVAHDAADSGNPIKIGLKAESSPKGITLVADGDRTDAFADLDGIQMVKIGTANGDLISESISDTGGTSTAFNNFTAVASTKNYVCGYSAFRTDAGTSLAYIDLRNGTGGAVIWRIPLPPNGGATLASAIPLCSTGANTALAYDVSAALTTVYLSIFGYQSKA